MQEPKNSISHDSTLRCRVGTGKSMAVNGEDQAIMFYVLLFSFQQPQSAIEISLQY